MQRNQRIEVLHLFRWSTHTHTLAQKYLIELLMWNVSYVQKNTPVNLTGEIGRPYVENSATYAFYVLAQRNVLMQLCQS